MYQTLQIFRNAAALASHSGARQAAIARNLANADTPGYRAVDVPDFDAAIAGARGIELRATRARHFSGHDGARGHELVARGGPIDPNGNSVSIENELVQAASAKSDHTTALAIFRSGLAILRASIGRG